MRTKLRLLEKRKRSSRRSSKRMKPVGGFHPNGKLRGTTVGIRTDAVSPLVENAEVVGMGDVVGMDVEVVGVSGVLLMMQTIPKILMVVGRRVVGGDGLTRS